MFHHQEDANTSNINQVLTNALLHVKDTFKIKNAYHNVIMVIMHKEEHVLDIVKAIDIEL